MQVGILTYRSPNSDLQAGILRYKLELWLYILDDKWKVSLRKNLDKKLSYRPKIVSKNS